MSFVYFLLHWSSIPSHTYLIPGLPPPLKKWLTQFQWLKPLGVQQWWLYKSTHCFNGGKGIPGLCFYRNVFVDSKVPCFFWNTACFRPLRGVDWFLVDGYTCHGTHQAWMIRTHSKFQVHIVTWQQTVITKTRQGDRDGWVGLFFREELLVLLRGV